MRTHREPGDHRAMDASLSRIFLFLIAAHEDNAPKAMEAAVKAMQDSRCPNGGVFHPQDLDQKPLCFPNLANWRPWLSRAISVSCERHCSTSSSSTSNSMFISTISCPTTCSERPMRWTI